MKWAVMNGQKGNELRSWDGKKIICKYSLFKECLKKIINPWDWRLWTNCLVYSVKSGGIETSFLILKLLFFT